MQATADCELVVETRLTSALTQKLDTPITELEMFVRTFNVLREGGIRTVRDLVAKSPSELRVIRGFGPKTLQDVNDLLARMGLRLGMDVPPASERQQVELRDYFAAAALPAVMAARVALVNADLGNDLNQESIAEECYELADALLAERVKPLQEA